MSEDDDKKQNWLDDFADEIVVTEDNKDKNADNTPAPVDPDLDELGRDKDDLEEDFKFARNAIKEIMKTSEKVLDHASDVAIETGHPRAIEVYSNMAKSMTDMAKTILDNNKVKSSVKKDVAHRTKSGIQQPSLDPSTGNTTNQTIFVGSTKEILDMIEAEEQSRAESPKTIDGDVVEVEA